MKESTDTLTQCKYEGVFEGIMKIYPANVEIMSMNVTADKHDYVMSNCEVI